MNFDSPCLSVPDRAVGEVMSRYRHMHMRFMRACRREASLDSERARVSEPKAKLNGAHPENPGGQGGPHARKNLQTISISGSGTFHT